MLGGKNIENQGVDLVQSLDKLSFLGFWEVVKIQTINNFTLLKKVLSLVNQMQLYLLTVLDLIYELLSLQKI